MLPRAREQALDRWTMKTPHGRRTKHLPCLPLSVEHSLASSYWFFVAWRCMCMASPRSGQVQHWMGAHSWMFLSSCCTCGGGPRGRSGVDARMAGGRCTW